ncbi:hypothetical protein L218DRAFT_968481 [Marasmius fiardii PR-910]|nr:hypothetical protein L218DRAFT_968481 [Marasmius fiardii PR-910]
MVVDQRFASSGKHVAIAVVGATGSGKSTFVNQASGANFPVGMGLRSCTASVQVAPPFELAGHLVTLIDTPGFDDTTKNDADILKTIAEFLAQDYKHGRTLAGILYLHRITDTRMTGTSLRNFRMFRQLCGDNTLKNMLIVTNMWGQLVDIEDGNAREKELMTTDGFFKSALDRGAKMVRHDHTPTNAKALLLRYLVGNEPLPLRIQTEMVVEHKDVWQTAAGEAVDDPEMTAQKKKHAAEVEALKRQMEENMRLKEEENRKQAREEAARRQAEIDRMQAEQQRLAAQIEAENREAQRKIEEARLAAAREAERKRVEIENLNRIRQEAAAAAAALHEALQRQLREVERACDRGGGGGCTIM